jgi:hypothetical protein
MRFGGGGRLVRASWPITAQPSAARELTMLAEPPTTEAVRTDARS